MNTEKLWQEALIEHILAAKTASELRKTLTGLLSPAELRAISLRLQIAKQLKAGIAQRNIAANLGVGIATVTRGSRELKAGRL